MNLGFNRDYHVRDVMLTKLRNQSSYNVRGRRYQKLRRVFSTRTGIVYETYLNKGWHKKELTIADCYTILEDLAS